MPYYVDVYVAEADAGSVLELVESIGPIAKSETASMVARQQAAQHQGDGRDIEVRIRETSGA